jgi:predicted permease
MNLRWPRRIKAFFLKRRLDRELEHELAAHVEFAIEDNVARGMKFEEARRRALVSMGGLEQARYRHREARGMIRLDVMLQDLRYTLRTLGRDLGFTIAAVLILALGIGANVAVFSVVNTLLLRPLPFPNAQELVWIAPPPTKCGLSCATYSTDAYDKFRAGTRSFQDVTGYFAFSGPENLSLTQNGEMIPASSIDVVANFFQVLGVQPAMGRLLTPRDGIDGAAPVIVLSNAWWRRQFNADRNIVGKTLDINHQTVTVIGVLPDTFDFGAVFAPGTKVDAITPLALYGGARDWGNIITMIGRMKPGISLAQAKQDSDAVSSRMCWNNRYPQTCGQYKGGAVPVPLKDYVSGRLRRSLVVLWSAVGMILLIACVNLSNLLLARAIARNKEFAMRAALGASRARIVGQLLTESLILSAMGAVTGLGLAWLLVYWLAHQGSVALPLIGLLRIDGAALGWTVLIAAVAAVLFGLAPGLRTAGSNLQESLKDTGAGSGQGRKHERFRSVLVVTEVALASVLLVSAGLLLRSFMHVLDVDLGFEPARAAAINAIYDDSVPGDKTGDLTAQKRTAIFQQMIARVEAIPGVQAAGITDYLPLGGNRSWGLPLPTGVKAPKGLDGPLVYVITPGYLRAVGTPIRGRDFNWDDGPHSQNVVIINRSYANFIAGLAKWPNGDALGRALDDGGGHPLTVIGIADDVHEENTESNTSWQIYYPAMKSGPNSAQIVIRSSMPPQALGYSVLAALRTLNPKQPASEFRPLMTYVDHANSPRRFFMLMVASFAGLGLMLAAVGIYGVISYSVTRQTQEIGIRMALGATTGRVQRQVLGSTMRLAVIGIALGAVASLAAARLVASLLFATSPWDGVTYVAVAVALLAVAGVAGYLPAWRASRIDPMVALRSN